MERKMNKKKTRKKMKRRKRRMSNKINCLLVNEYLRAGEHRGNTSFI
jgi:hypothetical protein